MTAAAESLSPDALLEAGLELHRRGDRAGALALYEQAAAARPDDPTALYLMGLAHFEAGAPQAAEECLATVTRLRPTHVQARMTLAGLRLWRGDWESAAQDYRTVIALEPQGVEARLGLGQALQGLERLEEALQAADAAAAIAPVNAAVHLARAAILTGLARLPQAAEACRSACAADPEAAAPQATLAFTLVQMGAFEDAARAAEKAVALDDELAEAWLALGAALRSAGRAAEAVGALERAVALDPAKAGAHLSLGLALADLEALDRAEGCLLNALAIEPDNKEAHANLASIYALGGRPADAIKHARRALELDPTMVTAHETLGALLGRDGDEEIARRHRDQAYGTRNLLVTTAAAPRGQVLILNTTTSGNIPDRHLIPPAHYTRMIWLIEYATEAQMADLPPYDVVFNGIGDPDLTGPTEAPVARFMGLARTRVLNDPAQVARTGRDQIGTLFEGLDVMVPRTVRLAPGCGAIGPAAANLDVEPPFLIRPAGAHGGEGLKLVQAGDPLMATDCASPLYATGFCDYRSADGLYRKFRAIFVDRKAYPYHLGISPEWMIHYERTGMRYEPQRLVEELLYLKDPAAAVGARAWAGVEAIGRRLDLDYGGLDFSVLEDGRVLVFEANATMLTHPEAPDGPLAHKNPFVETILTAFQDMLARASG